jgi:uncharacterized membrane protein YdjX (TVP38/TMEM64 family)
MKRRHNKVKYPILLMVLIIAYFVVAQSDLVKNYLANPTTLREIIVGIGILAPLAVIILQTLQTIISIIPSQVTTIIAGFIFGPILGLVYSLIGAFLGSAIIFLISKKYGNELALKFFDQGEIKHFRKFFKREKMGALFLARVAPIFPNDLVSFAAGLTKIRFRDFNIVSTIGFVAQMIILTYFGSELAEGKLSAPLIALTVLVSLLFLALIFKEKIKRILIKDFKRTEKKILF